jgi:hypothetical protein
MQFSSLLQMTLVALASSALAAPSTPACTPCGNSNGYCGVTHKTKFTVATVDKVARTGWTSTRSFSDVFVNTKDGASTLQLTNDNDTEEVLIQIKYQKGTDIEFDLFTLKAGHECLVYGPTYAKLKTDDFIEAQIHI